MAKIYDFESEKRRREIDRAFEYTEENLSEIVEKIIRAIDGEEKESPKRPNLSIVKDD